jgi:hypothetical protein
MLLFHHSDFGNPVQSSMAALFGEENDWFGASDRSNTSSSTFYSVAHRENNRKPF